MRSRSGRRSSAGAASTSRCFIALSRSRGSEKSVITVYGTQFSFMPGTDGAATTVYAGEYANPQEGRRLWLSATVDF